MFISFLRKEESLRWDGFVEQVTGSGEWKTEGVMDDESDESAEDDDLTGI